ncbi:acyl-CoA dehydrogenase [Pendulispora albinea]|uniref:Acyl-CoA dehydrogenase n=1 Tax=Pendulispora albinea TaxID=2741071 RepID=A0ABZ2LPJ2_9BACT
MSKPIPAINRYKADLRELNFLLFEQFRLGEILGRGPFEAWGEEEVRTSLAECYRFVREVTGPLNSPADAQGCRLEGGKVITPPGFKEAWKQVYAAGWKGVGISAEYGGAGAPNSLHILVEELLSGSNVAFNMYPGLAYGASELIEVFGTHEQKELYCRRMFDGTWGGTMNLTEPQAGSDVGASTTTAKRNADGSYSIRGTKIFISGGDHDLAENIIHLVLARVEGSPAGTKGLTLFIVPKFRPNPDGSLGKFNDVTCGAIEHKMGINGSSTCVLNYGENDACIGWPVGGEEKINQGMPQMFRMMNGARIAVGIQSISVASTAYLNALEYAKDRKQGASITHWKDATAPRVSIIQHADVRRMLLDMKARVEGIRALAVKLAHHLDMVRVLEDEDAEKAAYHQGQVDLLVPLVKAYGSDQAFRVCELAIQTYGGAGYTRDYPVEQYCRDAKIFSIYEGTNHIQAMDLVGRKLGQAGGANLQAFLGDIAKFVATNSAHPVFGEAVKRVGAAQEALAGSAMKLLTWFQSGHMELVPLNANRFLEMISELTVSALLLEGAILADEKQKTVAAEHPDHAFYEGKKHTALYYARTVLPGVEVKAKQMLEEDRSALDIPDLAFATV